jgi:parallel beta-helix repeat protein
LEQCGAFKNVSNGIQTGSAATVQNCKARDNGGKGIVVGSMSRVSQCAAGHNADTGIEAAQFCQITACGSVENGLHGISVDSDSRIIENASSMNNPLNGAGINVYGKGNRLEGNNVTQNRYGILFAPSAVRNLLVGNSASGNTNNYWGIGGTVNAYGALINMTSGGVISNAASWANFEF